MIIVARFDKYFVREKMTLKKKDVYTGGSYWGKGYNYISINQPNTVRHSYCLSYIQRLFLGLLDILIYSVSLFCARRCIDANINDIVELVIYWIFVKDNGLQSVHPEGMSKEAMDTLTIFAIDPRLIIKYMRVGNNPVAGY